MAQDTYQVVQFRGELGTGRSTTYNHKAEQPSQLMLLFSRDRDLTLVCVLALLGIGAFEEAQNAPSNRSRIADVLQEECVFFDALGAKRSVVRADANHEVVVLERVRDAFRLVLVGLVLGSRVCVEQWIR